MDPEKQNIPLPEKEEFIYTLMPLLPCHGAVVTLDPDTAEEGPAHTGMPIWLIAILIYVAMAVITLLAFKLM